MPGILTALEALIEPSAKGDPEKPMRWSSKALRKLASELKKQNFDVSYATVALLLKQLGYSLQLNKKEKEGASSPDRNAQFEHINKQVIAFQEACRYKRRWIIGNIAKG